MYTALFTVLRGLELGGWGGGREGSGVYVWEISYGEQLLLFEEAYYAHY